MCSSHGSETSTEPLLRATTDGGRSRASSHGHSRNASGSSLKNNPLFNSKTGLAVNYEPDDSEVLAAVARKVSELRMSSTAKADVVAKQDVKDKLRARGLSISNADEEGAINNSAGLGWVRCVLTLIEHVLERSGVPDLTAIGVSEQDIIMARTESAKSRLSAAAEQRVRQERQRLKQVRAWCERGADDRKCRC